MIMMNDGRPMQDTTELRKKRLLDISAEIQQLSKEYERQFSMAIRLSMIQSERLYLDAGFKNIYDYALQVAGLKRISVNNYIRVATRFLNPQTERSIFAVKGRDFTISQLTELVRIDKDDAIELVKSGKVKFGDTARDIKAIVAAFKESRDKDIAEAQKAILAPFESAHEAYHKAYNELKEHLIEAGDDEASDKLLPAIMDAVVILYQEGLKGLNKK